MKGKIIGTAYVNIVEDENGEIQFEYGYDIDKKRASINEIMALQSFLNFLKEKADLDFENRLEVQEKKFEVKKQDE